MEHHFPLLFGVCASYSWCVANKGAALQAALHVVDSHSHYSPFTAPSCTWVTNHFRVALTGLDFAWMTKPTQHHVAQNSAVLATEGVAGRHIAMNADSEEHPTSRRHLALSSANIDVVGVDGDCVEHNSSHEERRSSRRRRIETAKQRSHRLEQQAKRNKRRRTASSFHTSEGLDQSGLETEEKYRERLERQRNYSRRTRVTTADISNEDNQNHTNEGASFNGTQSGPQLQKETPEHRAERLAQQQIYNKRRRKASNAPTTERQDQAVVMETEEQYHQRLERQRLYRAENHQLPVPSIGAAAISDRRQNRSTAVDERHTDDSGEESQACAADLGRSSHNDENLAGAELLEASFSHAKRIEEQLQIALGAEGLDEGICAVCDRLVLRASCHTVGVGKSDTFMSMVRCLKIPQGLPPPLEDMYNCGDIHEDLSGMLLSRKGVKIKHQQVYVTACDECYKWLTKGDTRPPKFSIANGFFVGQLPDHLLQATWIEKIMTQLVTVVAQTRIMRGGRHRSIRSHCLVFDATPGPPATLLPRRIDRSGPYQVILAGPMTTDQRDSIRKLHQARGIVIQELLGFFKANNHLYASVDIDQGAIREGEWISNDIFIEHDDGDVTVGIDEEQDSVASRPDNITNDTDENAVIEQNVLLTPDEVVANSVFAQRVVDLNPFVAALLSWD